MPLIDMNANWPGIIHGDCFRLPGEMVRNPQTGAETRFLQRYVVKDIRDGRLWFHPTVDRVADGKPISLALDNLEGAYCLIDDNATMWEAWRMMNGLGLFSKL